jgi:hypothetical protein
MSSSRILYSKPADFLTLNSDVTIIKQKSNLTNSIEKDAYSKSYSYHWLLNKDTLDFVLCAFERKIDKSIQLSVHHKKPMLLHDVFKNIEECIPILLQDFELSKFNCLVIQSPIYYLDITKELSNEYISKYGRTRVDENKLNKFLINSILNKRIDSFSNTFNKKVSAYGIEKFHLLNKKNFSNYLPEADLEDYPEFTIDGLAVYIYLKIKILK